MQTDKSVERPLRSLRVIEFEGIGPGPLAGRMLSDLGAHVIVVARPTPSAVDRTLIGKTPRTHCDKEKKSCFLISRPQAG